MTEPSGKRRIFESLDAGEAFVDRTKGIANRGAQDYQDCNDDNGDERKKQSVFNQPLSSFTWCK